MKPLKNKRLLNLVLFLTGVILIMSAWTWSSFQTDQTTYFNRGTLAYTVGDYDLAEKDFDFSLADYHARGQSFFSAPASLEQAIVAEKTEALALVKTKQFKPAVAAFKQCLYLSSDYYVSRHQVLPGGGSESQIEAANSQIQEDGTDCKIDLTILFRHQQSLSDAEGQGKGSPQQSGDKTSEDPSNAAGGENRSQVNQ
jgi:tetratricopeptide (TPR) repeat protein